MEVPFDRIGPGQVGRLAVQVIGRDGPVLNPAGIRYLPPDSVDALSTTNPTQLAGALAGLNVLATAGNIALTAATLAEVRRLGGKVDAVLAGQHSADKKLDAILSKLQRIQSRISEARLSEWARGALRSSAESDSEIGFAPFAELANDLEVFLEEAEFQPGLPLMFKLGSDTREALQRTFKLLRGSRLIVASMLNGTASAENAWRCDPVEEYWPAALQSAGLFADLGAMQAVQAWDLGSWSMHQGVFSRFSFDDQEDHDALQDSLDERVLAAIWTQQGMPEGEVRKNIEQLREEAAEASGVVADDETNPWLSQEFTDAYAEATRRLTRTLGRPAGRSTPVYPLEVLDAHYDSKDDDDVLEDYSEWWLYGTDAGLIHRVYVECVGVRDGYSEAFETAPETSEVGCASEAAAVLDFSTV